MPVFPAYWSFAPLGRFALAAAFALASCTARPNAPEAKMIAGPVPQRIVSLVPSMTEDLFAVGAGPSVVGVSVFTDYPPQAKRLPIVATYARYSAEALVARQPDLLVVDPDVRLNDVLKQPPWNALRAVKQHRVYTLPDAAILERPGPRYNDGLAWLIATLEKVRT